jgi:hypothetical protein
VSRLLANAIAVKASEAAGVYVPPILAIDPGTNESAWLLWDDGKVRDKAIQDNEALLEALRNGWPHFACNGKMAIEMIASYGMAVGAEVFETCIWIGRFMEAAKMPVERVYRKDVKLNLCGTVKAKDPNVRQALIDRLGAPGTKSQPGATYGVSSHCWAALAVAVTAADRMRLPRTEARG